MASTAVTPVNQPQSEIPAGNGTDWGALSDLYKMRIRLCNEKGELDDQSSSMVVAVALDGVVSFDNQYSNPFDNSNPEQRLPTMMGMLQAGDWVNTLDQGLNRIFGVELSDEQRNKLNTFQGRTNFTKANSTQIFVSSQAVTITTTLYFSAFRSAQIEVENQLKQLQKWSVPQSLAKEGVMGGALANGFDLDALFPSKVPPYVAFYYSKKCFLPMLIQSVSTPLILPMDRNGDRIYAQVDVTFMSRQAWDAADIDKMYGA